MKEKQQTRKRQNMCEKQTSVTSNDRKTHKFKLVVSIYDACKWECLINYELVSCNAIRYFKSKCWLNAWMTTMTTTIEVSNRRANNGHQKSSLTHTHMVSGLKIANFFFILSWRERKQNYDQRYKSFQFKFCSRKINSMGELKFD